MRYISSFYNFQITSVVKALIVANVGIWFFLVVVFQQFFLENFSIFHFLGLSPQLVQDHFWFWQFFTYMFLHSPKIFHILFNMFVLWMFGSELERFWGSRLFSIYYIFCGVGAGLLYYISASFYISVLGGDPLVLERPVIGASGAIFGLLLAYGLVYGERIIYFMLVFPMKARNFIMIIAAVELVSVLNNGMGSPVANLAHLGGLISGLIFFKLWKLSQKLNVRNEWKNFKGRKRHLRVLNNEEEETSRMDWH